MIEHLVLWSIRHSHVRLVLAFAAEFGVYIYVTTKCLRGPPMKSLCGLKQAPMFTSNRPSLGFKSSYADPSLFIRSDGATGVLDIIG